MKLATRVGVFVTASLLACGSVSAAHATVDEPPFADPTEPHTATTSPSEPPPTVAETLSPGDDSTADSGSSMACTPQITETDVTILLQTTADFDDLTVTAGGESVAFELNGSTDVIVDRTDATDTLLVELWDDNGQRADACVVEAQPLPSPSPDEPNPSGPTPSETEEPTEPTEPEPEPEPEPTESEPTSQNPTPPPTTGTSPGPSGTTQPPRPTSPSPTEQSRRPPYSASPPAPRDDHQQRFEAPTTSSGQPLNRHIRRYSDSPRYLLPQFFGMNSHRGSPLIMPRPRDSEQRQADLETLPPISEDELDAIKAQLSSPGRADHSTAGDELQGAAIDERVADQNSWWLIAGMTAIVCVSASAWWALTKRKRNH